MSPLAILSLIGGVFKVGKILWNAGSVIRFLKTVSAIGNHLVTEKRLPNCGESKDFLDAVKTLLEAGVIDIPGIDEAAIVKAIVEVEQEISCKTAA